MPIRKHWTAEQWPDGVPIPTRLTHYVPVDSPTRQHRRQMALCGKVVDPRYEHAAEPTCPECKRIAEEDDRSIALLRQEQEQKEEEDRK